LQLRHLEIVLHQAVLAQHGDEFIVVVVGFDELVDHGVETAHRDDPGGAQRGQIFLQVF
jgi:hypothetical protein